MMNAGMVEHKVLPHLQAPIVDPMGQWAHPGENTIVPTEDGHITMKGVPYPVYGEDEYGNGEMMYPEQEYQFPGKVINEYPMMARGGMLYKYRGDDRGSQVPYFSPSWRPAAKAMPPSVNRPMMSEAEIRQAMLASRRPIQESTRTAPIVEYKSKMIPKSQRPYVQSREDLELDENTRKKNQGFVNSLNMFGYLPKGVDRNASLQQNMVNLYNRGRDFISDWNNPDYEQPYQVSPNSGMNLNKPSHRRRYDATQLYFGLPQNTFVEAERGPMTGSDYPSYSFKDNALEQRYKDMVLRSGFFQKLKEAEAQGKKMYAETTHDPNAVANAFTLGISRGTDGQPFAYYYDKWDLATNPADLAAETFGNSGRVQNAVSSLQNMNINIPLMGPFAALQNPVRVMPKGRPFNMYGRIPITSQDSVKYARQSYRKLPSDQYTWNESSWKANNSK